MENLDWAAGPLSEPRERAASSEVGRGPRGCFWQVHVHALARLNNIGIKKNPIKKEKETHFIYYMPQRIAETPWKILHTFSVLFQGFPTCNLTSGTHLHDHEQAITFCRINRVALSNYNGLEKEGGRETNDRKEPKLEGEITLYRIPMQFQSFSSGSRCH